jgi:hypothetical protein
MKLRLFIFVSIIALVFTGGCGDGDSPDLAPVGEACVDADDCEGELCLQELGTGFAPDPITFDGGYCSTGGCEVANDGSNTCDDGTCLYYDYNWFDDILAVGYCFEAGCEIDDDCRDGYTCANFSPENACIPIDAVDGNASKVIDQSLYPLFSDAPRKASR